MIAVVLLCYDVENACYDPPGIVVMSCSPPYPIVTLEQGLNK